MSNLHLYLARNVGVVAEGEIPAGQGHAVGRAEVVELFTSRLKSIFYFMFPLNRIRPNNAQTCSSLSPPR